MKNSLQIGIGLVGLNLFLVMLGLVIQLFWTPGEYLYFLVIIRIIGQIFVMVGLSKRAKWAWYAAVIGSGWFGFGGVLSLTYFALSGFIFTGTYQTIMLVLIAVLFASVLSVFIIMLLPSTRAEFKREIS